MRIFLLFALFLATLPAISSSFQFDSHKDVLASLQSAAASFKSMDYSIQSLSVLSESSSKPSVTISTDCQNAFISWGTSLATCFADLSPTGLAANFSFSTLYLVNNLPNVITSVCAPTSGCFAQAQVQANAVATNCALVDLVAAGVITDPQLRVYRAAAELICSSDGTTNCATTFTSTLDAIQADETLVANGGAAAFASIDFSAVCTTCWAITNAILSTNFLFPPITRFSALFCLRDADNSFCLPKLASETLLSSNNYTFVCSNCFQRYVAAATQLPSATVSVAQALELHLLCAARTPTGVPCLTFLEATAAGGGLLAAEIAQYTCWGVYVTEYFSAGGVSVCPQVCTGVAQFWNSLSCCAAEFSGNLTKAISSANTGALAQDVINSFGNTCGFNPFTPPASCTPPSAVVVFKLALPNFAWTYYLANTAAVQAALLGDLVLNAGVLQADITIVSVTQFGSGVIVQFNIAIQFSGDGIALVNRLNYLVSGGTAPPVTGVSAAASTATTITFYAQPSLSALQGAAASDPTQSSSQTDSANSNSEYVSTGNSGHAMMQVSMWSVAAVVIGLVASMVL